jgi:Flp pilus assembly pilin Flp
MISLATLCSKTAGKFRELLLDESAATAIEYAMIAAGIGTAIAATVFSLGSSVRDNLYQKISDAFQ